MKRRAVDRPFLFAQEDRPGEAAAHLQPGAERPRFLAHQMVMAGIGTLEPVDKNPISFAGLDQLFIPPNDDILLPDDDLPPPPVQKPKAKRKRKEIKFLTEDELARLFSVIHSVRDRAIFQLAYRAGLRASEVGLLQLRDYDPKADRIFIHRLKGSNSGHHHLVREEARALRAWLKVRGSFPGPIFLSKQKRPIDRTTLHLLMKKYGAAAGIPAKLRHF